MKGDFNGVCNSSEHCLRLPVLIINAETKVVSNQDLAQVAGGINAYSRHSVIFCSERHPNGTLELKEVSMTSC